MCNNKINVTMGVSALYDKVATMSPKIEVFLRQLYWKNFGLLSRLRPNRNSSSNGVLERHVNFDAIMDFLRECGCDTANVMVAHTSYKSLKPTGLTAEEIIEKLLSMIGSNGTLVMPVIRTYAEEGTGKDYITQDYDIEKITCLYDVKNTKIHTGYLPICLMKKEGSVTSRFPLNTVTAFGPLAQEITSDNLDGEEEAPNGPHSAWKHCLDMDATIVFIGADVTHSLTMIHTNEDAFGDWPIRDWYRKRRFKIVDGDFTKEIVVKERRPLWGTLYYLERTLDKDLKKEGILRSTTIDGVTVGVLKSKELVDYLNSRKDVAYPYSIPKKYFLQK